MTGAKRRNPASAAPVGAKPAIDGDNRAVEADAFSSRKPVPTSPESALVLLAITAQLFEIDDRHATIFESEQPLPLQSFQALVGILPGDAGESADLLLRDLQMARQVRIENGIEQRCDASRQTRGCIQRASIFGLIRGNHNPLTVIQSLSMLMLQRNSAWYAVANPLLKSPILAIDEICR